MKSKFSTRLILWYSSILFIALFIFGILSYYFISHQLYSEQFATLAENCEKISEVFRIKDNRLDIAYLKSVVEELNLSETGIFFEVWDSKPERVFRSPNFPVNLQTPSPASDTDKLFTLTESNGIVYHLYETPVNVYPSSGTGTRVYHIRTGQSIIYIDRILQKIQLLLLLLVPIILLFAGLGGWYLTGRALKPIADITRTARDISLYHLDRRLPRPHSDDELSELVHTLNDMINRIEKGVRNIQQFTADASHELRTPITAMRGEIEVALRRTRSREDYKETLKSSLQELQWMEKMVNDLLLLSRADAGELNLNIEPCNLAELIQECYHTQTYTAQKKNIRFQINIADKSFTAPIDSYRIRQVLCNLLDNALKYTADGGMVTINAEKNNSAVEISITDNGCGIAENDLPLVFNRFYRADKSRGREEYSSGLGLSICKWIVEAHRGKIELQSSINKGTTVTVKLPV
jgi:heavy metal sensor kinase